MTDRELFQQSLEALGRATNYDPAIARTQNDLRERLSQPCCMNYAAGITCFADPRQDCPHLMPARHEQEPVACLVETEQGAMVWPIQDYDEASTYCPAGEWPVKLYTHPAPQPEQSERQELLECDVPARPLSYPLRDYHTAMTEGPLHYTWTDKPHRLVYDLIAAVRYYATKHPAPQRQPLTEADSRKAFEAFVRSELGDIAVMDEGRYISPKIQNYWLTWQAAQGITGGKT